MIKCCLTCKQPLPPKISVSGRRRQLLLDYVLAHPQGVSRDQIVGHVWSDDPDGGPSSTKIVSTMTWAINKLLEKAGEPVRVRGQWGRGNSLYKAVYLCTKI